MLFIHPAAEIAQCSGLDLVRRYLQIQSLALWKLDGDIAAGIVELEIFAQFLEADIDVPAAGDPIQAAGQISELDIAAAGPCKKLTLDDLALHIAPGCNSMDSAFQQTELQFSARGGKTQITLAMGSFDVAAAGAQIDLVFRIGDIDISAGGPPMDLACHLVDIHITTAGAKLLVSAGELFQGDIAAAGPKLGGNSFRHIYFERYAEALIPIDMIVLGTGGDPELMVVCRDREIELFVESLFDLFIAEVLSPVVPDIHLQFRFIVRYAGDGYIASGGPSVHLLDGEAGQRFLQILSRYRKSLEANE